MHTPSHHLLKFTTPSQCNHISPHSNFISHTFSTYIYITPQCYFILTKIFSNCRSSKFMPLVIYFLVNSYYFYSIFNSTFIFYNQNHTLLFPYNPIFSFNPTESLVGFFLTFCFFSHFYETTMQNSFLSIF